MGPEITFVLESRWVLKWPLGHIDKPRKSLSTMGQNTVLMSRISATVGPEALYSGAPLQTFSERSLFIIVCDYFQWRIWNLSGFLVAGDRVSLALLRELR
jgi:hypothetical protein